MSLPYLPLYIDDYEAATAHLSMLEDGAYCRLLRLCWRSPGCKLPSDEQWIMRKLRATTDAEIEAVRSVIREFFTTGRGRIWSKRLLAEHVQKVSSHEALSKAGKAGGYAKALKTKKLKAGEAKAKSWQPEPEPEPENTSVFSGRARAQKPPGWVHVPTPKDAASTLIAEIEEHERRRTQNGNEITGDAVLQLPAVRVG